jgi:hypothetical protein
MRSRASSFKLEYPLVSPRSSSNCLRLLPRLLVTSFCPFIFPSITSLRRQFLRKIWPIQLALRFLQLCLSKEINVVTPETNLHVVTTDNLGTFRNQAWKHPELLHSVSGMEAIVLRPHIFKCLQWLIKQDTDWCQQGTEKLVPQYDKRLNCGEDYVEMQRHSSTIISGQLPLWFKIRTTQ